ncbi:MAG TPA: hypothetical protein VG013_27240 [Gemmataceae bacterium]|nr:hypothetical protein [Gemmataceae bacterium]
MTLRDPQASRLIRRHFIAVSVDVANAPEPLPALFPRTGGKTMPFLLYLTDRGQYVGGTSGLRTAEDVRTDLEKVLTAKGVAMPKSREAPLAKQVNALGEALDGHQYRKASTIFSGITRARGYSPAKDAAYDRMDAVQAGGTKKLEAAVGLAKEDRYAEARAALAGVPRELAGLPVAEEGKGHLAALKLLESAHQLTQDKKRGWQRAAFQRLSQVIRQHGDTPYANLAARRQAELVKGE